jgi:hypothetical protein
MHANKHHEEKNMGIASWVIVDNATGQAVMETFKASTAVRVNAAKYTAVPIEQYLMDLNRKIKSLN